ncbi:lysophosphatidic acid receptor 4-like [Hydractinia symbiolongicarpus]|uniref:lysophosphatidic acid receptor 4-like n=1 Tax=Hydractinia symbiolongicarpus TaxID=13093 RepID=UPI002550A456|nr:lysophosphatidic acid receptor 4-like [Hydractinia symbiolongicarpus]
MTCPSYNDEIDINLYFHSIIVVYSIITSVLVTILNSIYLISVIKYTRHYFPSEIMYTFLSTSDLLLGLVWTPAWCTMWILSMSQSKLDCLLWKVLITGGNILAGWSLFKIGCITVDIYMSIIHPFFYDRHVTNRRAFILVAGLWMFTITLVTPFAALNKDYWSIFEHIAGTIGLSSCVIISLMHIKIYFQIKGMCKNVTSSSSNQIDILKTKKKSAKTGLKILVTFILCYLPMSVCVICRNLIVQKTFLATYAEPITICIFFLNPLLDPFLYYFRLSRIRTKISRLFNRAVVHPTTCDGLRKSKTASLTVCS